MNEPLASGQSNTGDNRKSAPRIGDSRPAPTSNKQNSTDDSQPKGSEGGGRNRRRRGRGNKGDDDSSSKNAVPKKAESSSGDQRNDDQGGRRKRRRGGRGRGRSGDSHNPVQAVTADGPAIELDEEALARRRGRERKGKPIGRYTMVVSVKEAATQISILEGRQLIEHYVSRPSDDVTQIHGNVYLGRVQNVLPGMEAAFVDISTPKNAVLYAGDVSYDKNKHKGQPRIESVLKNKQLVLCQVTKNPIDHKGARLTQEVSLPGRFVVLVPNSTTGGISKRLPESERKRLRKILDRVGPKGHGIIVRTAAENVTSEEIEADVRRLAQQWDQIEKLAAKTKSPALLYREPDMALRVIREEFNKDFRSVIIDDKALYEEVSGYISAIMPALAGRVEYHNPESESLTLFERHQVHDQLLKAIDSKVWLPGGGSLIIERTEALTVIDVNTGKNVGRSSLEETVYANNLEAATEIARQLRLRDIGGIIVIDFVDMEVRKHRDHVVREFRDSLARDKTRTQVYDISDLGLVEMTRKRIGEGLLQSLSVTCGTCDGRGFELDAELVEKV